MFTPTGPQIRGTPRQVHPNRRHREEDHLTEEKTRIVVVGQEPRVVVVVLVLIQVQAVTARQKDRGGQKAAAATRSLAAPQGHRQPGRRHRPVSGRVRGGAAAGTDAVSATAQGEAGASATGDFLVKQQSRGQRGWRVRVEQPPDCAEVGVAPPREGEGGAAGEKVESI